MTYTRIFLGILSLAVLATPALAAQAPGAEVAPLRAGELREFDGMEFVWVPPGEFRMGTPTSADGYADERPVTQVRISRGFWLGQHEVTQAEWQAVMGTNPSRFSGCGQCPVEQVSWNDAQEFIGNLNVRGWRESIPVADRGGVGVRGAGRDDRRPLWERRCDRVGRGQQRRSPASGGTEGAERVGAPRHAGERVRLGRGLVWRLSGRCGDGPAGSRVRRVPGSSGR